VDLETPSPVPKEYLLVVEDDVFISRLLCMELAAQGYEVASASNGAEALEMALGRCPDLILADVMMPVMDGFELARRLRSDPRTENVGIIMVTARGLSADRLEGISSGADDYITKPFDNEEVLVRVRTSLNRAKSLRASSPLTGLPGNLRIEDEVQRYVDAHEPFALMYLDLDNFKSYSDRYGFVRGDEALRRTGQTIRDAAREVGGPSTFVGHIGGDDFVVLTAPERAMPVAEEVIRRFDSIVPELYAPEDAERGFLESENRRGQLERFPMLTISIGIATSDAREYTHRAQAVEVATEMKNFAKRSERSSYEVDRRADA
jgi:diguanylate cyclase (GGDEF)-like protein